MGNRGSRLLIVRSGKAEFATGTKKVIPFTIITAGNLKARVAITVYLYQILLGKLAGDSNGVFTRKRSISHFQIVIQTPMALTTKIHRIVVDHHSDFLLISAIVKEEISMFHRFLRVD